MFSSAALLLAIASLAAARPQAYIPTSMPSNTTGSDNPAMFLEVYDSNVGEPCSNKTATLYPNFN